MLLRALVLTDKSAIQFLIKDAFSGFPWYLDYSQSELDNQWQSVSTELGFAGLVATNDEGTIVGASWWHLPSPDTIRGNKLASFILNTRADRVLIWEDAILVRQMYQRQRIGETLRRAFIDEVRNISDHALILSRMRSDNVPSLLLAEKIGFIRTGARSKEKDDPPIFQEYWYLLT